MMSSKVAPDNIEKETVITEPMESTEIINQQTP